MRLSEERVAVLARKICDGLLDEELIDLEIDENDFRFMNAVVKAGGAWNYRRATFQGGIQLRSISYELDQLNRVTAIQRDQRESWMEWTPSLGVSLRMEGAVLHYSALITTGTGRPGVGWGGATRGWPPLIAQSTSSWLPKVR